MAKTFAPRISKKERKTIDLSDKLPRDLLRDSSVPLFRDAKIEEVYLQAISVKEQVRTKFVDSSIKKLAENIKVNGLIQPLVLHRDENNKLTLICGERRYRAMSLIKQEKSPCFILDKKGQEELMAIQFSENSSREELHFIDKAVGIYNYQLATGDSERKIQAALSISKSEVHRGLIIGKLPKSVQEAAKQFNVEKYVLLEFSELNNSSLKKDIAKRITSGDIRKRTEFKAAIKGKVEAKKRPTKKTAAEEALIKLLSAKGSKGLGLDKDTTDLLKSLL